MKHMVNQLKRTLITVLSILMIPSPFISQDASANGHGTLSKIECKIDIVDPPLALNRTQLAAADDIEDLNPHYKPSWIKEFKSVELRTVHEGVERTSFGIDDRLTPEQKSNLQTVDEDTEVIVSIKYIPDNSLPENVVREIKYKLPINPDIDARFPQSEEALEEYLKAGLLSKIPEGLFQLYQLAVVGFVIDEEGQVIEPQLMWSTEDTAVDELMVDLVCNMPKWIPAQYKSGLKVRQEFVLNLGDMSSCVSNLVNNRNN